jgi:hypothetical protein
MSRALDQFGDSLVRASQDLHRAGGSRTRASRGRAAIGGRSAGWVARTARRLHRRPVRVLAGVAVIGALGAAGATLLGPQGDPRAILSIECGGTVTASATGSPVSDCAVLWPSLHHEPAPRLVAWVAASGGAVVVVPAGAPPAGAKVFHWRRLPAGWTQGRAAVLLAHQLEDISTGLQARTCWSAGPAKDLVRSALNADGLAAWRIDVRRQSGDDSAPTCLTVAPIVQPDGRSVALVERPVRAPARGSFRTPASAAELGRVASVEHRVNLEISADKPVCAGVSRAAALWRTRIRQVGLPADRYGVIAWPHAPVSGGCAHVYVTAPGGGGPYDVYVAG